MLILLRFAINRLVAKRKLAKPNSKDAFRKLKANLKNKHFTRIALVSKPWQSFIILIYEKCKAPPERIELS